ncbi:DUF3592 domain-containing protein [Mucilaginibacter flavus]|uniref:DUF3592 domain-containing protein n=1 Tax=Mucilaginibacter flavus TaxID=931504 RepID=UPI0025B3501B|nr:DUF3592 domain-containing protein [Mucilaginibacter flavus]MDN3582643.1 DUF3592 domain-containing protein [Mucilaginibacter flavus]
MFLALKTAIDDNGVRMIAGMLGFFVVGIGVINIFLRSQLMKTGVRVPGKVIKIDEVVKGFKKRYYPVFRYQTLDNETITQRSTIGYSMTLYIVGEQVKIIYDPTEKDNCIVDNLTGNSIGYLIAGGGIIVILAAIFF